MNFTTKKLEPKSVYVIHIENFKIRIAACQFFNGKIKIIDYIEQREDFLYTDFEKWIDIAEDIKKNIQKLEKKNKFFTQDIIINFPLGNIYAQTKKISLSRIHENQAIDEKELKQIIFNGQKHSIQQLLNSISENYGLGKEHLKLILSRINQCYISGKQTEYLEGKTGKNIDISLLNIFVETTDHDKVIHLASMLDKNLIHILPSEYTISFLTQKPSCVIINIESFQTKIIIKKDKEILAINRISIGIEDLIQKIKDSRATITRQNILDNIEKEDFFVSEKNFFSDIWKDAVAITLKEMLDEEISPNIFCFYGPEKIYTFLESAIKNIDFFANHIKIILPIKTTTLVKRDESIFENTSKKLLLSLDDNHYSMILEASSLIHKEKQELSRYLQKIIKILGFEN